MQDHIGHREPTETKSRYENLLLKRPEEENAPLPTKLFGDLTISLFLLYLALARRFGGWL